MTTTCSIRFTKDGAHLYYGAFQPFSDALRQAVPVGHRRWDPDPPCYWVSLSFAAQALDLAREHFVVVDCFGRAPRGVRVKGPAVPVKDLVELRAKVATLEQDLADMIRRAALLQAEARRLLDDKAMLERALERQAVPAGIPPDYRTLFVLPGAPPELVKAAYRALALLFHPDRSRAPDATERMKALNGAYERIARRR